MFGTDWYHLTGVDSTGGLDNVNDNMTIIDFYSENRDKFLMNLHMDISFAFAKNIFVVSIH